MKFLTDTFMDQASFFVMTLILILIGFFIGKYTAPVNYDLNDDGKVDVQDMAILELHVQK